ncbi:MAG: hypothetical protein ABIR70_13470 [Bryobacteraceae bacterium]
MSEKQHAHELLDRLGPAQLSAVLHLLESIVPSQEDGDTLSAAERKAVVEADEWLKQNKPILHEDVVAQFGLTTVGWEKMGQSETPNG